MMKLSQIILQSHSDKYSMVLKVKQTRRPKDRIKDPEMTLHSYVIWSSTKAQKSYDEAKTTSLKNGARKTEYSYVEDWS
jgi:hypothetical protein